jgi:hypothetical protein
VQRQAGQALGQVAQHGRHLAGLDVGEVHPGAGRHMAQFGGQGGGQWCRLSAATLRSASEKAISMTRCCTGRLASSGCRAGLGPVSPV